MSAPAGGRFRITAHFGDHVPGGPVSLRIGDEIVVITPSVKQGIPVDLGTVSMPVGEFNLECWRDCGAGGFAGGIVNAMLALLT